MVKTPPERLAAALRANLKRRKAAPGQKDPLEAARSVPAGDSRDQTPSKAQEKTPKTPG